MTDRENVPALHRHTFRRAVRLPCQVVRERDFKLIGDLAFDLSAEGMLATSRLPVLTGEPVIVTFRSQRLERWFDAEATVARVIHGRRLGDHGRCIGLSFHDTDARFRDGVFQSLRRLPPPLPRRPPSPLGVMAPMFSAADGRLVVQS